MSNKNPITGDVIKTKPATGDYGQNYDRIFRKSKQCCGEGCGEGCVRNKQLQDSLAGPVVSSNQPMECSGEKQVNES